MRAKSILDEGASGPARGRLARLLDARQARGKLVGALDELARDAGLSRLAARRQFERLVPKAVRLPGRPSLLLTVPPEDRPRGAPPVAAWLHDYMSRRAAHYYVGLLSAAALHGSSNQVPLATQVVAPHPLQAFELGRVRVEFIAKRHADRALLAVLPGLSAPMNVSTPAATVLDLVAFNRRVGGMARVLEITAGLKPKLTPHDLREALQGEVSAPVMQRTGHLLELLECPLLASVVERALPSTRAWVPLQTGALAHAARRIDRWRVLDNVGLAGRAS
jgi:predicted transcriptional regulator of viral defense system